MAISRQYHNRLVGQLALLRNSAEMISQRFIVASCIRDQAEDWIRRVAQRRLPAKTNRASWLAEWWR